MEVFGQDNSNTRRRGGGGGLDGSGQSRSSTKKTKMETLNEDGDYASPGNVPWNLSVEDPDFYFGYGSAEDIHVALTCPQLPAGLVRGANPAASRNNLRNWVRNQMMAASVNSPVALPNGTASCNAFHQMTPSEWTSALLLINNIQFGVFCLVNNVSCGSMWAVHDSDSGTTTLSLMKQGPFNTEE